MFNFPFELELYNTWTVYYDGCIATKQKQLRYVYDDL